MATKIGAQSVATIVERHVDRVHVCKVAQEVAPGAIHARRIEAALRIDLEARNARKQLTMCRTVVEREALAAGE
jgi:hypothetical protein